MRPWILAAVLLLPLSARVFAYQSWSCENDKYSVSPDGPDEILSCIREAWVTGSGERLRPESVTRATVLIAAGEYTPLVASTLDRRLHLLGYPGSKFLKAGDFEGGMTAGQLIERLIAQWSQIYCTK